MSNDKPQFTMDGAFWEKNAVLRAAMDRQSYPCRSHYFHKNEIKITVFQLFISKRTCAYLLIHAGPVNNIMEKGSDWISVH